MNIRTLILTALVACFTLGSAALLAHGGAEPKHGGIVQISQDLVFELVNGETGAAIYIDDHGQTLPVDGISGKLTVLSDGKKSDFELLPQGDHLVASGAVLASGSKVVAAIKFSGNSAVTVRFAIK